MRCSFRLCGMRYSSQFALPHYERLFPYNTRYLNTAERRASGHATNECPTDLGGISGFFEYVSDGCRIDIRSMLLTGSGEASIAIDKEGQRRSDTIKLQDRVTRNGRQSSQNLANELLSCLQKNVLTGADISMHQPTCLKCK